MPTQSNWPSGINLGHSNYTLRFPRVSSASQYDGVGGWAKNSSRIPRLDAALYVGGTAAVIWATVRIALWIWG